MVQCTTPENLKVKKTLRNVVTAANEARVSAPSIPPGPMLPDAPDAVIPMPRVPPALRHNDAEAARRDILREGEVVSGGKSRGRILRRKRRTKRKSRRRSKRRGTRKRHRTKRR